MKNYEKRAKAIEKMRHVLINKNIDTYKCKIYGVYDQEIDQTCREVCSMMGVSGFINREIEREDLLYILPDLNAFRL